MTALPHSDRPAGKQALRKHAKELNCLYAIADLIEKADSLEKILQDSADMMVLWHTEQPAGSLPPQWSGMTGATMLTGGICRREFRKTAHKLLY